MSGFLDAGRRHLGLAQSGSPADGSLAVVAGSTSTDIGANVNNWSTGRNLSRLPPAEAGISQQCNERAHFHVNGGLRRLTETLHLILHQVVLGNILQPHVEHVSPSLQKISSGILPDGGSFLDGHRTGNIHHVRDSVLPPITGGCLAPLLVSAQFCHSLGRRAHLECKDILNSNQDLLPDRSSGHQIGPTAGAQPGGTTDGSSLHQGLHVPNVV
jgi:hypothetical protein